MIVAVIITMTSYVLLLTYLLSHTFDYINNIYSNEARLMLVSGFAVLEVVR